MPGAQNPVRSRAEARGTPYTRVKIRQEAGDPAAEDGGSGLMFGGLPSPPRKRWTCFGTSVILQAALAAFLIEAIMISPAPIMRRPQYSYVALTPYIPPVNHEPQQVPAKLLKMASERPAEVPSIEESPAPVFIRAAVPKPVEAPVKPPEVKLAENAFPAIKAQPQVPKLAPPVKTGDFSTGSSATPTAALAPGKVQTGGFGDPNGVPASNTQHGPVTIAQAGSFDLPAGPGYGNGTGGSRGAQAVVVSTGFGNGTATRAVVQQTAAVRAGSFGDVEPVAQSASRPKAENLPNTLPVEVLSKPTPAYTAEARSLHLEGEVLLEVVFSAAGSVKVVKVVRGLGHGLDESAIRAAEQIRFKPATRAGVPVDFPTKLHIVFQLT